MEKIKSRWNNYLEWQKEPYSVAPMSDEEHVCATCETKYVGNFCPRCGQSAKVQPKMSLWKTFLLFLDVWGVGNRGMFRTLRDLILRPGYLILDYLRGKHGAYFPPFKLLFLLTTLSLLVDHGFNLYHENYTQNIEIDDSYIEEKAEGDVSMVLLFSLLRKDIEFNRDYPALSRLAMTFVMSFFFFIYFKKTRSGETFSFHEFIIAMVYMVNMANIYTIVMRFFGAYNISGWLPNLFYLIPLKQMSGYTWGKTIWKCFLSLITFISVCLLGLVVWFFIAESIYGYNIN